MSGVTPTGWISIGPSPVSTTLLWDDGNTVLFAVTNLAPVAYMGINYFFDSYYDYFFLEDVEFSDASGSLIFAIDGWNLEGSLSSLAVGAINLAEINTLDDTFYGNSFADFIRGGPGYDDIFGGAGNDTTYGDAGQDFLFGEAGNDILYGGLGDDALAGGDGNDTLHDESGVNVFDGGAGRDVLLLTSAYRSTGRALDPDLSLVLTLPNGAFNAVENVEEIRFADGRLVLDASDPAAQVVRLYNAALGRGVDQGGLNYWTNALQGAATLTTLAQGFLDSAEFALRFGSGLSDEAFATQLYQNVLHRAPDQGGLDYWTGALAGRGTRADVLVAFSESAENKTNTAAGVAASIWDVSEEAAQVARLYDTVFGRQPDVGGLAHWRAVLDAGAMSLNAVAGSFVASAEFQTTYGRLDDQGFAAALYRNTLDREPDANGLAFWTAALDRGMARSDIVLAFSESAEHMTMTAPNVMSENPAQFGILFT